MNKNDVECMRITIDILFCLENVLLGMIYFVYCVT